MENSAVYIVAKDKAFKPAANLLETVAGIIEDFDFTGSEKPFVFDGASGFDEDVTMEFELKADGLLELAKKFKYQQISFLGWEQDELIRQAVESMENICSDDEAMEIREVSLILGQHSVLLETGEERKVNMSLAFFTDEAWSGNKSLRNKLKNDELFSEAMISFGQIFKTDCDVIIGAC